MSLADTLSGWDALESQITDSPTTGASSYTPPSQFEMSGASFGGGSSFMSAIPDITKSAGDILSGFGSYMQGQEAAGADEYNASLSLLRGQFKVEEIDLQKQEELSTQKAIYARSGVEQTGSVFDVAVQAATNYEYDKQVATFNAQSEANMYNYEAKIAKQKGQLGLASGLLKGAGDLLPLILAA